MARKSKQRIEEDLNILIRKRASKGISAAKENRDRVVKQKEFLDGTQWTDADLKLRKDRPCLAINRINPAIDQAVGDQRQALPGIKVRPVTSDATVEWAQIKEGKIRHITAQLSARQALNKASQSQLQGGVGYIRVITEFANDDTWEQKISVIPVYNEMSVVWDPAAVKWDRSDAQWLIVYQRIGKDEYKEKYGDEPSSLPTDDEIFQWRTEETVIIAEYFYKEYETKTIYALADGTVTEDGNLPEQVDPVTGQATAVYQLDEKGKPKKREIHSFKIYHYTVDGAKILEEKTLWPAKNWGVIPVWGKSLTVQGKEKFRGITWDAMDAQRLYNYYVSASAETYSRAPKAPVMLTPQMISGHEDQWNNANSRNDIYLLINPVDESDPKSVMWPQPIAPPPASQALVMGQQQAAEDIRTTTGRHLAALGAPDNATSGVAVTARQREGDVGDFEYTDNLNMAWAKVGEVILELFPTIYDTTRVIRTVGEDGVSTTEVPINQPASPAEGMPISKRLFANDMTQGKYEVVIDVGPSYSTQRAEAAALYTQMIQTAPGLAAVMGDIMMRNYDAPEAQTVALRIKAEMFKSGKAYLFTPQEIQELQKKLPLLAMPTPPNPALMSKVKQEQMKALKHFMDAMKIQAELGTMNESHAVAMLEKMNEIMIKAQQQEQQAAMQGQKMMGGGPGGPMPPGGAGGAGMPGMPPQLPPGGMM